MSVAMRDRISLSENQAQKQGLKQLLEKAS